MKSVTAPFKPAFLNPLPKVRHFALRLRRNLINTEDWAQDAASKAPAADATDPPNCLLIAEVKFG